MELKIYVIKKTRDSSLVLKVLIY